MGISFVTLEIESGSQNSKDKKYGVSVLKLYFSQHHLQRIRIDVGGQIIEIKEHLHQKWQTLLMLLQK